VVTQVPLSDTLGESTLGAIGQALSELSELSELSDTIGALSEFTLGAIGPGLSLGLRPRLSGPRWAHRARGEIVTDKNGLDRGKMGNIRGERIDDCWSMLI